MTPEDVRALLEETAVLALSMLGPSVVVAAPPPEEAGRSWLWYEAQFVISDPRRTPVGLINKVRMDTIRSIVDAARQNQIVRFAEVEGRCVGGPGGDLHGSAGPIRTTLQAVKGMRAIGIDWLGKPHVGTECDRCGASATVVVQDQVNVTLPGDSWSTFEPLGLTRSGCAEHPVEVMSLLPDQVPKYTPWWRSSATAFYDRQLRRAREGRKKH